MITVQRETSDEIATTIPSSTAIHSAIRSRRCRSQRPARVEWWSIAPVPITRATLPSRFGQPQPAERRERRLRRLRRRARLEEAVERRAGAADVGPEGAVGTELGGERRAREVVRRQRGEVSRRADAGDRFDQRGAAPGEAGGAVALVE